MLKKRIRIEKCERKIVEKDKKVGNDEKIERVDRIEKGERRNEDLKLGKFLMKIIEIVRIEIIGRNS